MGISTVTEFFKNSRQVDSLEISLKNLDLNSFNSNIIVATLLCLNKVK